jgi:uncharacterized protein with HEPN domain
MPPTTEDRLLDMQEAISALDGMIASSSLQDFQSNPMLYRASERLLEIICEASRHLPESVKQRAPQIEWRKIVDFGNYLRHAYHSTRADIVWEVIQRDLPDLKAFVDCELGAAR